MNPPETEFVTEWIKVPASAKLIFVGREVVCIGSGCHLLFYSLANGQQHIYSACGKPAAEGIQCYAGHRQQPILAFAEKCLNPRLLFIKYPDFQNVEIIEDGAAEGYLAITFSDHEYFISLSNIPRFELIVWNWRTRVKLVTQLTKMDHPKQMLCYHSPDSLVQFHVGAKKFLIWDIYNAYKHCLLLRHIIEMPFDDTIVGCTWNTEGALFILNEFGCIYMLNTEALSLKIDLIIYGPKIGSEMPCFCWYKGGLLLVEPNLDIKHFSRHGKWFEDWSVSPTHIVQLVSSSGKDYLIGWSTKAEILELDMSKFCFNVRKQYENNFEDICQINPNYSFFVTYAKTNNIKVWGTEQGNQVGILHVADDIKVIASNPVYPYIGAGLATGVLLLVSVYSPQEPKILAKFNLLKNEITKIVFNETGNIIAIANLQRGNFVIIQGVPGEKMQVISYVDYLRLTVDICVTEDEKNYRLYILVQNEKSNPIGDRVILKTVNKINLKIRKKKFVALHNYSQFTIREGQFYAKPFNSRNIDAVELKKKKINITHRFNNGHLLKHAILNQDNFHFYTYGLDGLVIVQSLELDAVKAVVMPHSPMDSGIRKVLVDPYLRYVISLGEDGLLVYTRLSNIKIKTQLIKDDTKKLFELGSMFNAITIGFSPTGEDEGKTYLDMTRKEKQLEENLQYAKERKSIMDDFLILKNEVIHLLNANLSGPTLEKIDILEFYLHTRLKAHKEQVSTKECEWTVHYCKELIKGQDILWHKMKSKYWDTMLVQRGVIKSLFSNFGVENYIGLPSYITNASRFEFAEMRRDLEEMLSFGNSFKPWMPMSDQAIEKLLTKEPIISYIDENARIMAAMQRDEDVEEIDEEADDSATSECYPSSVVSWFIKPNKHMYQQEEIHTYIQMSTQKLFFARDTMTLRDYFNIQFSAVLEIKVRDVNSIVERNNRLRYILSELKNTDIIIEDPIWAPTEVPNSVIIVKDSEVGVRPYISPSQQAHLDWLAAEEERIRLLLLADDFRERALMKMMDGVLEIRWEDTLKRDIPKPKCMLEKEPESFNEEDIRAIRDYEEKVAFLNSERQRYKNMLEQEYGKVAESIRESVRKFNLKLRELLLLKIKVETGRSQQAILRQYLQTRCKENLAFIDQERDIKESIKKNDSAIIWLYHRMQQLLEASVECRAANDILFTKDRQLEKNFKRDFQDLSTLVQEQTFKLYKKNPKAQTRGINNASLLVELGTCCISQERTLLLTIDCLEYLKSVDMLDQFIGVPNTIDEIMYKTICRHRRLRLDNDIRAKANLIEQSEIENAIQIFQKYVTFRKENTTKLYADLDASRENNLNTLHNKQLQIVIPQGLVEVPLKGLFSDFNDAIMVNRNCIENINTIIRKAGQLKIKVMKEKMLHRRNILMKEWEHKSKKMKIEDLKLSILDIKHIKVTKEIIEYLCQKGKGESLDKGTLTLDQEIEMTKKSYEKLLTEKQKAVTELEKHIKDFSQRNQVLDRKVAEINIDVCEQRERRDLEFEKKEKSMAKKRMASVIKRSKLIYQIQDQHNEILVLQSELELLRLKTYPTLKYKTL